MKMTALLICLSTTSSAAWVIIPFPLVLLHHFSLQFFLSLKKDTDLQPASQVALFPPTRSHLDQHIFLLFILSPPFLFLIPKLVFYIDPILPCLRFSFQSPSNYFYLFRKSEAFFPYAVEVTCVPLLGFINTVLLTASIHLCLSMAVSTLQKQS